MESPAPERERRPTKVTYKVDREEVDLCDDLRSEVQPRGSGEAQRSTGRYTRQSTKAKQHWKTVRKHVEQKSQRRASIRDKWIELKRSVSHEMEDFFVAPGEDREALGDWQARSERLHKRSFLLRNKKRDSSQVQSDSQGQFSQGLLSHLSSRSREPESIYSFTSGSGGVEEEEDDTTDVVTTGNWMCKTPKGRLSTHSRQASRISSGSSRRMMRFLPSLMMEKDSVFKMAVEGIKNLGRATGYMGTVPHRESSIGRYRSITPATVQESIETFSVQASDTAQDVFFDEECPTSPTPPSPPPYRHPTDEPCPPPPPPYGDAHTANDEDQSDYATFSSFDTVPDEDIMRPRPPRPAAASRESQRMPDAYLRQVDLNSDRRQLGIGMAGTLLGVDYRESRMDSEACKEILKLQDYRPFFTYWVTFVQIIIYVFTIAVYDVAPLAETDVTKEVRMISMGKGVAHYKETGNMWFGPKQADLIHLGAKYSPCMRLDKNVDDNLKIDRNKERTSGCCVYNDGSGCAQMVKSKCSQTFATWKNMTVCGQDPHYCRNSSLHPLQWSKDDITDWPICVERLEVPADGPKHMTCEVIARPCCIGIHGQCIITTSDDCEFRRGYFHPEASLCSQVKSCMSELCGMLPFYNEPNQFYRLWTSLLLHAGIVQLLITVVLQLLVLRDLEKLLGWLRIGCIYIISGIAGSLASAIFLPYHAEAGPSGSQFAIIACLFVELIQNWKVIDQPCLAVLKLAVILFVLFIAGLLPWVDNYAHLFGFIFGFLLSFTLMPYVKFNILTKRGRIISVAVCVTLVVSIFSVLIVLFYVSPIYSCPYCHYFNCIPFTRTFCKSTEVNIDNKEF